MRKTKAKYTCVFRKAKYTWETKANTHGTNKGFNIYFYFEEKPQ